MIFIFFSEFIPCLCYTVQIHITNKSDNFLQDCKTNIRH